jgi:hypothetical protein
MSFKNFFVGLEKEILPMVIIMLYRSLSCMQFYRTCNVNSKIWAGIFLSSNSNISLVLMNNGCHFQGDVSYKGLNNWTPEFPFPLPPFYDE